ncbi:hypothetical protein KC218_25365, partial [Mycobacterium tuberculosis]|nr:hypothetical protein [Mycobacterium tuberculosis]
IWSYFSIVATSFLLGAAIPLGTWVAMQLGTGHAGAFALGYKMLSLPRLCPTSIAKLSLV